MDRQSSKLSYRSGQVVFALARHFQPWPARVVFLDPNAQTMRVEFLKRDRERKTVTLQEIIPFDAEHLRRLAERASSDFIRAVRDARDILMRRGERVSFISSILRTHH
jgi:hypothetical protein